MNCFYFNLTFFLFIGSAGVLVGHPFDTIKVRYSFYHRLKLLFNLFWQLLVLSFEIIIQDIFCNHLYCHLKLLFNLFLQIFLLSFEIIKYIFTITCICIVIWNYYSIYFCKNFYYHLKLLFNIFSQKLVLSFEIIIQCIFCNFFSRQLFNVQIVFVFLQVKLQTQDFKNPKYRGTWDCFIKSAKKDGVSFTRHFQISGKIHLDICNFLQYT